jgi:hypothetical protein
MLTVEQDTPPPGHRIVALDRLHRFHVHPDGTAERKPRTEGGGNWHRVECECVWSRQYVSRYRAETMHDRHARELATEAP